jgi:glycosyltransferase involved in cell wall biosynthesis
MLANIIAALDPGRYEPIVVTPPGDVVEQFEAAGAAVAIAPRRLHEFFHTSLSSKFVLHPLFVRNLLGITKDRRFWRRYIRDSGTDLVHLDSITLAPMALSVQRSERKVVCLVQETAVQGSLGVRTRWLSRLLNVHCDVSIFISDFDKAALKGPEDAPVIPNWVDFREFDRAISQCESRERLRLDRRHKVVLFMGGISEIKGTIPLLEACRHLGDIDNLVILLAGYAHQNDEQCLPWVQRGYLKAKRYFRQSYFDQAAELLRDAQLAKRVRVLGMVKDVVPLYAAADVVVFPAARPHQARPVLEAGAMAKPVVVTEWPQLAECVMDRVTGLTVKPGDDLALAGAVRELLEQPARARAYGMNNFQLAYSRHNRDRNAPRFTGIYDRLLC